MVGSAEQSGGGVASVLRLMKTMPFWEKYHCGWLGTQIQRGYGVKLWFALKAYSRRCLRYGSMISCISIRCLTRFA